jgi:diketogulonate reductase-like aldo/keto reductase
VLKVPVIQQIAKRHNRSTAAVVLNYQVALNISVNPGFTGPGAPGYKPMSTVVEYMKENLGFFDFDLTAADITTISSLGTRRR